MLGLYCVERYYHTPCKGMKMAEKKRNIPRHIAIIMDGNGRWARQKSLRRIAGHEEGGKRIRDIVETCGKIGVEYLTLYAFSAENWKRPKTEINFLMKLLVRYIKNEVPELNKDNVVLRSIGRIHELPKNAQKALEWGREETINNTGLVLTLALNYGGRAEIIDAIRKFHADALARPEALENLDEESFRAYLYAPDHPDPDLVIRTANEMRISNFLLWEISYSEIWVTRTLWPEFTKNELLKAVDDYTKRIRKFGNIAPS